MTYNLRSKGHHRPSGACNITLVDQYLREWRQAQRDSKLISGNSTVPNQKLSRNSPSKLYHKHENERVKEELPRRMRAVSECVSVTDLRSLRHAGLLGATSPARTRSSRNRTVSETVHNHIQGIRRSKSSATLSESKEFSLTRVQSGRSRSGSKSKLRRSLLDIDSLSESFSASAKIPKFDSASYTSSDIDCMDVDDLDIFPFQNLPTDCKLKVFSYIGLFDKGRCMKVCQEWYELVKTANIWDTIDFTQFQLCSLPANQHSHTCNMVCYKSYKDRIYSFVTLLQTVRPVIKHLLFHYDINDVEDNWLQCMESVFENSNCRDLRYAHLNWKETAIRPFWNDQVAWSNTQYNQFVNLNRRRQRKFTNFFDKVTQYAPNIVCLVLPFDWSYRSIQSMARLTKLQVLVLEKYFVFQAPRQSAIDDLLKMLTNLRKLVLEIWSPSGKGMTLYHIFSESVEHLDISQCRGFYLEQLDMPKLETICARRHPWNGPLVCTDTIQFPCLHSVLSSGAPNLQKINEFVLDENWTHEVSPELNSVLKQICSCRQHKTGWAL